MKFRVKVGTHIEEDGTVYKADSPSDTIETDNNLVAMFPEKFERLDTKERGSAKKAPQVMSRAEAAEEAGELPGSDLVDDTEKVGTHVLDNPETERAPIGTLHLPARRTPTLSDLDEHDIGNEPVKEPKKSPAARKSASRTSAPARRSSRSSKEEE